MSFCLRKLPFILAFTMAVVLFQGIGSPVMAGLDTCDVFLDVEAEFEFEWPDTIGVRLAGRSRYIWSEAFPFEIDSEIDTCNLRNRTGYEIWEAHSFASLGKTFLPEHDPWIESFFDIFLEVQVPQFPGETLTMSMPLHLVGMANSWPPYFDRFATPEGMPPIPLYLDGIEVGRILSWEQEMVPYYEPEVHAIVSTAYRSEVAEVGEEGLIAVSAGLSGDYEATEAIFSYRVCGYPGPFLIFAIDTDGSAPGFSTIYPEGSGDGWTGYFDPGSDPFEGQCVQFETALLIPPYGFLRDTVDVWVDAIPPIPVFHDIPRDSIANFDIDSFFDITYRLDDELPVPGIGTLQIFPLKVDFARTLTPVDQLGLGTDLDSVSCGPSATASCLKYFADNGYPGLDNPGGDEAKPEQSGEDIARELQRAMGTDSAGTTPDEMVSGIESYLDGHGQSGWDVGYEPVDDATDLAEMFREFQSDSEDVIVIIEDTTAAGDTIGHAVTLGSTHTDNSETPPATGIDFMDPWGGGEQADNDYPLDNSGGGSPTTDGYDLDGAGGDGKVTGYVKVSPPEPAPGATPMTRRLLKAASRAPWIIVNSGPVRGNGIVDTLHIDTSPFPGGLYLMEVVTIDDQGFECRDIRLAGIVDNTVGDDHPGPGIKTMLRGSYPNPFNPWTTIEFSLARDARVTLVIYDVAGHKVKTLVPGILTEAGVHKMDWDGKNDNGKQLASGVYFAKFLAEGQVSSRKLILLR